MKSVKKIIRDNGFMSYFIFATGLLVLSLGLVDVFSSDSHHKGQTQHSNTRHHD